jgi:hypothetical protein
LFIDVRSFYNNRENLPVFNYHARRNESHTGDITVVSYLRFNSMTFSSFSSTAIQWSWGIGPFTTPAKREKSFKLTIPVLTPPLCYFAQIKHF